MVDRRGIRILVADDHSIVRQGIVSLLNASEAFHVVAEASDGVEAVDKAVALRPAVAVIDLSMPKLSGLEVVHRLQKEVPDTKILVLTMHDDQEYVVHLVRAGASGYLLKDSVSDELIDAVKSLSSGKAHFGPHAAQVLAEQYRTPGDAGADPYGSLTAREREVFHLVVEGSTTKEVARKLEVSVKTAENHRARVMDKLGVHNTAELVRYAAKKGLLH